MAVLSEKNSVLTARKIKKMLGESKSREQLITIKKYFKLFKSMTPLSGLAEELQKEITAREKILFPEHGHDNLEP
jgi:hypothetical protein